MQPKAYEMKKIYATNKAFLSNKNLYQFLIIAVLLISTVHSSYGQVRVPFAPRTSSIPPSSSIYTVKGDFTMIGNTNLTLVNYSDGANNNADMRYVDIDGIADTFNSSSAYLDFSAENGAIPECSNIIYAGLYWTGRAATGADNNTDGDNNPNTFQVTKDGNTKFFDKQKVSIKGPSNTSYFEVTANASDIYYPSGEDANIYSAYAEITDYVIQNGIGDYFVADIATVEGNGGNTGFHGGWGMVVVYENSKMKWRDITVFDGHAFVPPSATNNFIIPVNGFNAVQNGDVNLKLGIMAGEGDVGVSGDYFEIERRNSGTFERLSHSGNTTANFFNSSITNTNRTPNPINNTGVDIAMFDIDNTANAIIDNNQMSTRLRYGSTQDTYAIFNVTFSVEAYIPETQGVLTNTTIDGNPPGPGNTTLAPNENADYAIEIKNTGTEAINNTVITVPIPDSVNPSNLNIDYEVVLPLTSSTNPNVPFYDPNVGTNGSIVWNLGTLPVPANPDDVLARISFSLTVTTDCTILGDTNFEPSVAVNGIISGVGAVSLRPFETPLIQGFITDGFCQGEPIPTPSLITIDYVDFINEGPTITCPGDIAENVDPGANGAIVNYTEPIGTDNAPGAVTTRISGPAPGDLFPIGSTTITYQVIDDCGIIATCSFTVTVTDDENPTITCPPVVNITADAGENGAIVTYADPVITDNSPGATITQTVGLASGSLFPVGTTTNTFVVTDASGNTATCSFTVTVTDDENPTITCPPVVNITADAGENGAIVTYADPTISDNAPGATFTLIAGLPSGSLFPVGTTTNTFEVTDAAGNTATCSFTVTVTDNELPIIICPADISQTADVDQCAATITITNPTATDNCSTIFIFNGTRSDNLALTDDYPVGVTTITWTATDEANNISIPCIQTITITDDEAPVFVETLPTDTTVECDQVPVADVLTAIDNCNSASVDFSEEIINGSCTSDYTIERTWIATDSNGNTTQHIQTIIVQDTTPPVLSLPANVTAECSDDLTPIAFGEATATDNCDTNPVITYVDVTTNGSCPGSFTITRTWTATDECGNSISADQTISTSDTTAPEFDQTVLPQDLTIECNSIPDPEVLTATDNCTTATVEVNDTRSDGDCPNNYIVTRAYTATDECGNTNTHVQTITVVDITPPTFVEALPASNLVVECDNVPDAETLTAEDTCGSATVSVEDVITNGNCNNNYTIARTWTATDECGLETKHTQIITVQDTTPPTFVEALPGDITVECDSIPNAETITATDNCGDATVEVTDVRTDGDCPNNYIISRTWTATDECGLMTAYTQTITVEDTTAPVPTSSFDETLNVSCTDVPDAPELEFTDNCSSNVIVVFNETNSFDENALVDYEIVRTWTVRDECGNQEVYTQTLFVSLDEIITDITAEDRCYDDGIVNLNDYIGDLNRNGVWELLEGDTAATLNENGVFDPTGLELSETFLPESGGIDYKFRYTTTDGGCISITELTMNINADCVVLPCGENDVVVSKAVTPNGDAYNEFFEISGIELCGFIYEVKIFNRWGALIYESNNYQNDWNGKAMNSIGAAGKVPNGTYYYIVILKNSGLNPITGPVYLGTK